MGSGYDEKDAAKDTGSSTSEVSRTWHQARDDAASSGHLSERNKPKVSDSPEGRSIWDFFKSKRQTDLSMSINYSFLILRGYTT